MLFRTYWRVITGLLFLVGAITTFFSEPFKSSWNDLSIAWKCPTTTLSAKFGLWFLIGVVNLVIWLLAALVQHIFESPKLERGLGIACLKASERLRGHLVMTIRAARIPRTARRIWWRSLALPIVDVYSREVANTCDTGVDNRPILPSDFRIYARCVKKLLDTLDAGSGNHRVWTILKRSITDWYNLFPVSLQNANGEIVPGAITRRWWEEYKVSSAEHRNLTNANGGQPQLERANIDFRRLIAHPSDSRDGGNRTEILVRNYIVYTGGNGAIPISEASPIMTTFQPVQLIDEVRAILAAPSDRIPRDALIHLIGTLDSNSPAPTGWATLLGDFSTRFHTGSGNHVLADGVQPGVYFKYLNEVPSRLRRYEDIFLIQSLERDDDLFGVALLRDETLDKCALRILNAVEIGDLIEAFEEGWRVGSNDFCVWNGD